MVALTLALAVLAGATALLLLSRSDHPTPAPTQVGDMYAYTAHQRSHLTLALQHPGQMFAPGAIGLSIETSRLSKPDLAVDRSSLVRFMRLLGPSVLRVGGNTLDRSWWTASGEPAPPWATSTVTPPDLTRLRELLDATNWRVILGVDLGHFEPSRAASEAHLAAGLLGSRLLGIEIGNEPNGYQAPYIQLRSSSYEVETYLKEANAYATAIHAMSPGLRLYGPELSASASWLKAVASNPGTPFTVLTAHYYPTSYSVPRGGCEGTAMPTSLDLLSPAVREQENTLLSGLIADGDLGHRPARITETNTTASCDSSGGPDTGPVFASALWSLDWSLRAAQAGITGLNFHGTFGSCAPESFSPLCASSNSAEAHRSLVPRPEYYGLLAAGQLEGGRFLPITINEPAAAADFSVFATLHSHGRITLAVDNFATGSPTGFSLTLPGYDRAEDVYLRAPSTDATSSVTFGGASFGPRGTLAIQTRPYKAHGTFRFTVPPAGAIIVTLHRRSAR
jgi:hypothetical protein